MEGQGQGIIMEVTPPTSPGTILLGKMAYHTKQIHRECTLQITSQVRVQIIYNFGPCATEIYLSLYTNIELGKFL